MVHVYVDDGDVLMPAHRVRYEDEVGPIPEGMVLDHYMMPGGCSTSCCNPEHVRPITNRSNILRGCSPSAKNARKSHCIHGHPLSGDNLMVGQGRGGLPRRYCRICHRARSTKSRARAKKQLAVVAGW
jgi:hypothetical protein